jgi:hypothetical protein
MQLIAALCLALFACTAVATFQIVTLVRSHVNYEDALLAGLNPAKHCTEWPSAKVVSACRVLLSKDNAPLADSIATFLANTRKTAAAGAALKGRIALRSENYQGARASLEFAASLPGGKRALRQERDAILDDFRSKLAQYKAPQQFIDITAELLRAGESPTVRAWTGNEEFWLRWNAVRILQAARKRVDMVPVYIQDLEHAGGMRTRIDAVEQLGELKDRRAVPHLKRAAAKGWRDPFVAAAAKEALEESFGK